MHNVITIHHPVPVILVPRGGRNVSGALAMRETPVRIRTADHRAFEPLPEVPDRWVSNHHGLHVHEGSLWAALPSGNPGEHGRLAKPKDFLSWLRDAEAPANPRYLQLLGGTPLMGAWGKGLDPFRHGRANDPLPAGMRANASRGEPGSILRDARDLLWDGTDAARANLFRFMEDEVRLTRYRVWIRVRPLAFLQELAWRGSAAASNGFDVRVERHWVETHRPRDGYPITPERAEAAARRWQLATDVSPAAWAAMARRFDPAHLDGADVDLMANWLPALAIGTLNRMGSSNGLDRHLWEGIRSRLDAVRPSGLSGLIGGNGGEGRERHLRAARDGLVALEEAYGPRIESNPLRKARLYLDEEIMPRAAWGGQALDAGDVEALAPLAP